MKILAALFCLLALPAAAQDSGFVFTRENLTLLSQADGTVIEREIPVQLRPYRSIEETDSFTLQLDAKSGLLLFLPADRSHILPGNVYAPTDLTVIGHDGTVLQIWPDIVLSEQAYALPLPQGSHALLLLRNGAAERLGVRPGARFVHDDWFMAAPKTLQ